MRQPIIKVIYVAKKKISFEQYFWVFLVVSILGTFYEEIVYIVEYFLDNGVFGYSRRSGVFWGPISPVYGFGAVFMLFFLGKKEEKWWKVFLKAAVLGGVAEFVLSYLQEFTTGTRSWDYSSKFLNIDGRTTVPYMIGWGVAGLILVKWFYPFMCRMIDKISVNIYRVITPLLVAVIFLDMAITWSALGRKEMRERGHDPYTFIGEYYDIYFNDEFIKEKYPNMKEK